MRKANFSDDFKRDAVTQITERGYPVSEVSRRLGVSPQLDKVADPKPVICRLKFRAAPCIWTCCLTSAFMG